MAPRSPRLASSTTRMRDIWTTSLDSRTDAPVVGVLTPTLIGGGSVEARRGDQPAHLDAGAEHPLRVVAALVVRERPLAAEDLREADDHGQRRAQVVAQLGQAVGLVLRHGSPSRRRRAGR